MLQVFWTNSDKEWGIKTLEELPAGAFVFEYVGEIITSTELSTRKGMGKYAMNLDSDWRAEIECNDDEALCIDASEFGNISRFLNHRWKFYTNEVHSFCYEYVIRY